MFDRIRKAFTRRDPTESANTPNPDGRSADNDAIFDTIERAMRLLARAGVSEDDRRANMAQAHTTIAEFLRETIQSGDTRKAGWAHVQLGIECLNRSDGDEAENTELAVDHLTRALEHLDRSSSPDDWWQAHWRLGQAYYRRVAGDREANFAKAIAHYEAALEVCTRKRDAEGWAQIKYSLGAAYCFRADRTSYDNGDRKKARQALQDALTVMTRERNPEAWSRIRETLHYLESTGDEKISTVERTITDLRAATESWGSENPVNWARNHFLQAKALERKAQLTGENHWSERAEHFEAGLRVYTIDISPEICAGAAGEWGQALAHLGRWNEAAEAFLLSMTASEARLASAITAASRRQALESARTVPQWASYCLAKAGRLTEAVTTLERGRARTLGEIWDRDHQNLDELRAQDPQLFRIYRDAADRLRRIQDNNTARAATGQQLTEVTRRVKAARDTLDGVIRRIRNLPGYESFLKTPEWDLVEAAVTHDAPVAYITTTPWGTLTLLIVRTESTTCEVNALWADDLTYDDLVNILMRSEESDSFPIAAGYLRLLYNIVETRFPDGNSALTFGAIWNDPGAVERNGREEFRRLHIIGDRVVAGMAQALLPLRVPRVVVIPAGHPLATMPLHTVPYTDGRSLSDDLAVSFAPSIRVLSHARNRVQAAPATTRLTGVGNPLPHPMPLWFAGRELKRVASLFDSSSCLLGEEATKANVLRTSRSATHVHLACHGAVPFSRDNRPHLQLASSEQLTMDEIVQNRPFATARLVTLSACQSALVGLHGAGDDDASLPTAVMASGVPGVIGALWPVNDLSTSLLMERFYTFHLVGDPDSDQGPMPPWEALRRAQQWLASLTVAELRELVRTDDSLRHLAESYQERSSGAKAVANATRPNLDDPAERPFANPYYWAPFVFIGE